MTTKIESMLHKLACEDGFSRRVEELLYELGIKKIKHVRVLMDATGFTRGGAVKMLNLDRPPRSPEKFESLVNVFVDLYCEHTKVPVSKKDMERYLLKSEPLPKLNDTESAESVNLDRQAQLAEFFIRDRALTSRVVFRIATVQQELENNNDNTISNEQLDEIHIRVINYCFNNEEASDEDIDSLIRSLFDIARKGILLM